MQRLGKYELLGELASGGMAAVYRARDTTLDREVALKVINKELLDGGEEGVRRFLHEAKVAGGRIAAGIAGGVSQEALAPVMAAYLESQGIPHYLADGETINPEFAALMKAGATIAGAAAGAVAGGNTSGAAAGGNVALTGVTNNYLRHREVQKLLDAEKKCGSGDSAAACDTRDSLIALDRQRQQELQASCIIIGSWLMAA